MFNSEDVLSIAFWGMVVVLIGVGGYFAVRAVRRWTHAEQVVETFSMHDLRQLRARGEITEQEFARMRGKLIAAAQAPAARRARGASAGPVAQDGSAAGDWPPPNRMPPEEPGADSRGAGNGDGGNGGGSGDEH